MKREKRSKREKSKSKNLGSVIHEKPKRKMTEGLNTPAAAMKERQYFEDTSEEYPSPPEEHTHELEMEKRLKRLIEERERKT